VDTTPDDRAGGARRTEPTTGDFLLVAGNGRLAMFPLAPELVIGRDPACDVAIDDRTLSRRHAVLRLGPPLTVQDLGSMNGLRIGGRSVRGGDPVALVPGEGFQVGPLSFVLVTKNPVDSISSRRSGLERLEIADPSVAGVPSFVRDVAATETSVLILGESGVGKDVLAETIHVLSRRPGEIARVNCAALAEPLIESELFGHEKGAFTGAATAKVGLLESAHGGTVFLDEIGELPLGIQAKLLRALEAREVLRLGAIRPTRIDVRFIAATNRDLPSEVAAKRFRHDLYFRLDGITLAIRPLRERRDRIPALALGFVADAARKLGRPPVQLLPEVFAALDAHDWPGNVRELKAVLERALLLARGGELGVRHLAFSPRVAPTVAAPVPAAPVAVAPAPAPDDAWNPEQRAERQRILDALTECAGNQTRAAKVLGISRTTLVNKLQLLKISRPRG
jgi:two-component system, NtrC family, response regulator AtoC